jgi:GT2 family glycosyltransferase
MATPDQADVVPIAAVEHSHPLDVSVIVSTCNRGRHIAATLASLTAQDAGDLRYEVIVVDNNSTDDTGEVVRAFAAAHPLMHHLFEPRQGVSHGRNAGLRVARGALIAFTDDDVVASRDWLARIVAAFHAHADVDYVSGPIVPIWETAPPSWMAAVTNGPCALRHGGDTPLLSRPGCFFPGWATANIAFRREVLDRVGLFNGEFRRGQDLELMLRVWKANGRGMYAPDAVVSHVVHAERMTKAYHRRWQAWQGEARARMYFREIFGPGDRVLSEPRPAATLFGVPAFVYRGLAGEVAGWLRATVARNETRAFDYECKVLQTLHYIRARVRAEGERRTRPRLVEIARFAKALVFRQAAAGRR